MAARVGGESEVEKIYGKTISELKASPDLRQQTRDNLIVQQERFKVLPPPASISRQDVETFYKLYKDSLPPMGAKVDLSTIIKILKTLPDQKDRSRKLAETLADSLKHGADFATLAKRYSDANAESGGDLGTFYPRGTFLPAVEEEAFKLAPGGVSGVIETEQGFHIIKLIERRGEEVHIAQILIKPTVNAADQAAVRDTLMAIRDSALHGVDFSLLAQRNSDDPETRPFGGELGKISVDNLDAEQKSVVDSLNEGEISMPIRIAFSAERTGYQIVKVNKKIPPHPISLEDDYRELEAAATQWKQTQDLQTWLARERSKIYVDVHDLAQFY
jgi:peptidyl-prolyl cis-trans isomerase SurA